MAKYDQMTIQELEHELSLVSTALEAKKDARRAELMAELEKLGGAPAKPPRVRGVTDNSKDGRAAPKPKYRSWEDPAKTWAQRGQKPTWLTDEMAKTGKPLEYFLIEYDSNGVEIPRK